jgi:hypothetical protein
MLAVAMIFKRKESFFLDLSGEEGQPNAAPPSPAVIPTVNQSAESEAAKPAEAPASVKPATAEPQSEQPKLTTAEAIAAELRAAQEASPEPQSVMFAPECLNPANALPRRRRLAGANLAGFKTMAGEMFQS